MLAAAGSFRVSAVSHVPAQHEVASACISTISGNGKNSSLGNEDTAAELSARAKELPDESYAFMYLFRMATEIGPNNPQTTLKLLDRASEFLDKVQPEKWQMQYQIGIAIRYCQMKSDRCFTMMDPIIRSSSGVRYA